MPAKFAVVTVLQTPGLGNMVSYKGIIKSFNSQTGWGFIECEQTFQLYGKDMFVLKSALPGGVAERGDQVSFAVVLEHNGPVATNVQVVRKAAGSATGGCAMNPSTPFPRVGMQPSATNGEATFVGTVKSFNAEKGWGMISCKQTEQVYGKDVFLPKNALANGIAAPGQQVRFSIKMESKGPAAASAQVLGGQQQFPMPHYPAMPQFMAAPMVFQGKMPQNGQLFYGIIKGFNEEKGWGHITCEATSKVYSKDVFVMRGALQGQPVQPGTLVSFKVHLGAKGPQANEVILMPPGSFKTESAEGSAFGGTVKSFNAEKGWGFITGEDVISVFSKDIFVHKRDIGGYTPTPGEEVQFSVEIDQGGQPVAKNLSPQGSFQPIRSEQEPATARVAPY